VRGLGFRGYGAGRVHGFGFRVHGLGVFGFRVQELDVWGLGFRV